MGWTSRALPAALSGVLIFGLGGCARNTAPNGPSNDDATQPVEPLPMIHTEGTRWVDANGQEVLLKGVNWGIGFCKNFG